MIIVSDLVQQANQTSLNSKISEDEHKRSRLEKFKENGTLRGEIRDLNQTGAKIILKDGTEITGKLANGENAKIGQNVSFTVKHEDGKVIIELEDENLSESERKFLSQILKDNGLKNSAENIKMLKDMIENRMPLNRETILKFNQAMKLCGKDGLSKALFFMNNDLRPSPKNLETLDAFSSGNIKLSKQLSTLTALAEKIAEPEARETLLKILSGDAKALAEASDKAANKTVAAQSNKPVLTPQSAAQTRPLPQVEPSAKTAAQKSPEFEAAVRAVTKLLQDFRGGGIKDIMKFLSEVEKQLTSAKEALLKPSQNSANTAPSSRQSLDSLIKDATANISNPKLRESLGAQLKTIMNDLAAVKSPDIKAKILSLLSETAELTSQLREAADIADDFAKAPIGQSANAKELSTVKDLGIALRSLAQTAEPLSYSNGGKIFLHELRGIFTEAAKAEAAQENTKARSSVESLAAPKPQSSAESLAASEPAVKSAATEARAAEKAVTKLLQDFRGGESKDVSKFIAEVQKQINVIKEAVQNSAANNPAPSANLPKPAIISDMTKDALVNIANPKLRESLDVQLKTIMNSLETIKNPEAKAKILALLSGTENGADTAKTNSTAESSAVVQTKQMNEPQKLSEQQNQGADPQRQVNDSRNRSSDLPRQANEPQKQSTDTQKQAIDQPKQAPDTQKQAIDLPKQAPTPQKQSVEPQRQMNNQLKQAEEFPKQLREAANMAEDLLKPRAAQPMGGKELAAAKELGAMLRSLAQAADPLSYSNSGKSFINSLRTVFAEIAKQDMFSPALDAPRHEGEKAQPDPVQNTMKPESEAAQKALKKLLLDFRNSEASDINKFLNEVQDQLTHAKSAMLKSGAEKSPAAEKLADEIKSNLNFMNQISNPVYVQLPVLLNDKPLDMELYVFTDKNKKKQNPNGVLTALVSVDLDSIGHFESYIQKKGDTVSFQFRLGQSDVEGLVRQNISRLRSLLQAVGCKLGSYTFKSLEQKFSLLDAEPEDVQDSTEENDEPKRITFDMRA